MRLTKASLEAILLAPWGHYTTTGSAIVWCASRSLCGIYLWGRPDAEETRTIVRLFDEYPRAMNTAFDVVIDTRAVEVVDGEALRVLTRWMWTNRAVFLEHARITSVIREGPTGFLLVGLLPAIVNTSAFCVTTDPASAFRHVLGDAGAERAEEIEAIVTDLRGVPRELLVLRALLARRLDATIEDAAKEVRMSERSLQRFLARYDTSFHDELVSARITTACELLLSTDLKVRAIASRIGISERAVTLLFRAKTGLTPMEWRKRSRGAP